MGTTTRTASLAAVLAEAKKNEALAKQARIVAEEALVAEVGFAKSEGQETYDAGDYRVTVKQPLTRKLDADALRDVIAEHPNLSDAVRYKPELVAARVKTLTDEEWSRLAKAVETKPGKVSVTLKEVAS